MICYSIPYSISKLNNKIFWDSNFINSKQTVLRYARNHRPVQIQWKNREICDKKNRVSLEFDACQCLIIRLKILLKSFFWKNFVSYIFWFSSRVSDIDKHQILKKKKLSLVGLSFIFPIFDRNWKWQWFRAY